VDSTILQKAIDKGDYAQAMYAAYLEISSLLERVNKHSLEQKLFHEKTFLKIESIEKEIQIETKDLRKSIYNLEMASLREDHRLNLKIVGWSSFIASVCATLASIAAQFIRVGGSR